MRRLVKKLANVWAAVAFAEEGEVETARELLAEIEPDGRSEGDEHRSPLLPTGRHPLPKGS